MRSSLRWLLTLYVLWTVFVWGNRISNAWTSDTESFSAKVASTGIAVVFIAFALVAAWIIFRAWKATLKAWMVGLLCVFAAWTVGVWVVRTTTMLFAEHAVGFKVVHLVLGLVSIGLALAVVRAVLSSRRRGGARSAISTA